MIDPIIRKAVEEYQCPGCIYGDDFESCYQKDSIAGVGCGRHCPGTILSGVGPLFLGLPRGFNRLGDSSFRPCIFLSQNDQEEELPFYTYNIPVWKYQDKETIFVRIYQPRLNRGWVYIILDGDINKINCLQLTKEDIEWMD